MHYDSWNRVPAWVEQTDPDNAWPQSFVHRQVRHRAASRGFHVELGEPWGVVAHSNEPTTALNRHVWASQIALGDSVSSLAEL